MIASCPKPTPLLPPWKWQRDPLFNSQKTFNWPKSRQTSQGYKERKVGEGFPKEDTCPDKNVSTADMTFAKTAHVSILSTKNAGRPSRVLGTQG